MQSLKECRIERGVTLQAVCDAADISRPTMMKYESEAGLMPVAKFNAVCDFLHVSPDEIFLGAVVNHIDRKEQ